MQKTVVAAAAVIALGAVAGTALAQVKPETLVRQRQAAMTLQNKYFGPLVGMAQGRTPFNAQVAQRNADYLAVLSQMAWDGFDPSTAGVKSRAKPELFKEMDKVKALIEGFQGEAKKLQTVAKSGDEAAFKAQVGAVNKACGACHDPYREER